MKRLFILALIVLPIVAGARFFATDQIIYPAQIAGSSGIVGYTVKAASSLTTASDLAQAVALRDGFDATNNRLRTEEAETTTGTVVTASGTVTGIPGTGDLAEVIVSNKSAANTVVVNVYDGSNNSGKMLDSFSLAITSSQVHRDELFPYSSGNLYVEIVGTSPSVNVIVAVKAAQAAN